MQLYALPAETLGRSSRRIVVNADELRANKLAAGDLVKVTADGASEPYLFLQVWPTATNPTTFGQLAKAHLLSLKLPMTDPDESDAPLSKINLTKVKMTKAKMRDAKLVGVTEVLSQLEETETTKKSNEEEEEAKERENAWVKVCVREALVDVKYLTAHTRLIIPLPSTESTRTFKIISVDDVVLPAASSSTEGLASGLEGLKLNGAGVEAEDDSRSVWQATWATEVLVTLGPGKGKGKAGPQAGSEKRDKTRNGAASSSKTSTSLPSYINVYPPPPPPNPLSANRAPRSGYSLLGGLSSQITLIRSMIDLPLLHPTLFRSHSLPPPRGILLHGPPGTGKTALARAIASSSPGCSCIVINGPELSSSFHGETEERLRGVWEEAKKRSPCVIVIDEIDALCPKREEGGGEVERRVVAQVLTLMDGMGSGEEEEAGEETRVVVVGATNRPNAIDPALRRPGRFDKEIEIGVPDAPSRLHILEILTSSIPNTLTPEALLDIASKTHGYVGADLSSLIREAGTLAIQAHLATSTFNISPEPAPLVLSEADLLSALTLVRPSAMREVFLETPTTKWSDIGGQEEVKQKLRECVEWPLLYKDTFSRLGVRPPRGVLLYGPPGCSKTLTAKALATESGINFLAVKGPELLNKYVGESERAVREVFRKARAASPSNIFIDEIDALCTARSSDDSHTDGILTSILNEMDGIEELVGVTVVAATNRPDTIDSALLRPGRIDRILYVGPPSTESREEIFKIRLAQMAVEPGVDAKELAEQTDGCSGAEIVQVCQDAALMAMNADLNAPFVRRVDFLHSINSVGRRITPKMIAFFEGWRDGSGARSA